jgi:hypothetical protein
MVQGLFRRDQKYFSRKNWALIYLRIAFEKDIPYSLIYSFNGVPNSLTGQIEFFGSFVSSVTFKLDNMTSAGLTYSIIYG